MSTASMHPTRLLVVVAVLSALLGIAGWSDPAGATPPPTQQTLLANGIHKPCAVAVDGAGNVYVSDSYNNRVVELTKAGTQIVLPIAVTNPCAIAVDAGGTVYVAETNGGRIIALPPGGTAFNLPFTGLDKSYGIYGVAVDGAGNVYVADTGHSRILKLSPGGFQSTVWLAMTLPFGVAVDGSGNVYASQAYGGAVAKLTPGGVQTALPISASGNWGLAVDSAGDVFVADFQLERVVELPVGGSQTVLPFSGLFQPHGVAVDAGGTVYVADYGSRILAIPPGGTQVQLPFTGLAGATGVATDASGNIYVADDYRNGRVQKVAPGGTLTDVGFTGLSARDGGAAGVAVDADGNVYVAIWFTSQVLKRTPAGVQTTLPFSVRQPAGVAVGADGTVYVTDTGNARVVKLPPGGTQSTVALVGVAGVSGIAIDGAGNLFIGANGGRVVELANDGTQQTLGFTGMAGASSVAVDPTGNVYVLDYPNNRVLELTSGGVQVTLGFTDIDQPWGIAADASGTVYVTAHAPSPGLVALSAGPPAAPASVTAEPGDGTATVTWQTPFSGGAPIMGYTVTPVVGGVPQTPSAFASTATSQTITGLTNGTTYTFVVAATNTYGTGLPSAASPPVTVGTPLRPAGFLASDPGNGSATLSWWPPTANAGPITGYTITPLLNGVPQAPQAFAGPATTRTVSGLTNGLHYVFRVAAVNGFGTGPAATTETTVGAPSRPWVFLRTQPGVTSASISWWAPPANGGAITGYAITPYLGWAPQGAISFASPATAQVVSGLTTGATYTFKVTPRNALGYGGTGSTIQVTIGAPTSPPNVGASAGPGTGEATVTWDPPQANAGPVSSYRVTPYIGWLPQPSTTVPAPSSSQTISGLMPGITYTFHVTATNAIGNGPASGASPEVTPA